MITRLSVATLNHLLGQQPELTRSWSSHAGKTVRLSMPPHEVAFTIADSGYVHTPAPDARPDATLRLSLALLPRLWLHDPAALRDIHLEGNTDLAACTGKVLQQLRWDATEDLSRLVGDIAAHRLQRIGRSLLGGQTGMLRSLAENLVEHWTEEQPLIARREAIEAFSTAVDTLRNDVERLEKRLARLAADPLAPAD